MGHERDHNGGARAPGAASARASDASAIEIRDLYLELLIGALTHSIYAGVDTMQAPDELQHAFAPAILESGEGALLFDPERARAEGRDWPLFAQTMIGLERMRNVRACVETVLAEDVPGDMIEAGAWRGGAAILMRGVLKAYGAEDRVVWVADSFQGLPPPEPDRYPADRDSRLHEVEMLAVPADEVRDNFRRYGLLDDQVRFVEGWFRDTLPDLRDHRWSVVRIDGDMYESTADALVNLYDGLSPGGYLIIDDFHSAPPCREAVDEFRRERGIDEPIEQIDWTGVFWRKRA